MPSIRLIAALFTASGLVLWFAAFELPTAHAAPVAAPSAPSCEGTAQELKRVRYLLDVQKRATRSACLDLAQAGGRSLVCDGALAK